MPQGHSAVSWTPENDVKLFLTVLAVQRIQVDCDTVAKSFGQSCPAAVINFISSMRSPLVLVFQLSVDLGPNVPGQCIRSRMAALRKKAKDMGTTTEASPTSSTKKRSRAPPTPTTPTKKPKLSKYYQELDDHDSDEDGMAHLITPSSDGAEDVEPSPAETTQGAKSRVSPRQKAKQDYKSLGDPFVAMENADSNGEKIFGHDKSESEDSAASDGEFATETNQIVEI